MNNLCNQACPYNTLRGCTIPEHPGAVCPLRNGNGTYSVWQSDESDYARGYKDGFKAAKAIEAEPVKRGRWEILPVGPVAVYGCSLCRTEIPFGKFPDEMRFCPNCGADMREEGT